MVALRQLIRRLGAARVTILAAVISIIMSVALTGLLDLLLKGTLVPVDLVIGFLIPLLVAPTVVYSFVQLSQRLDQAEAELIRLANRDDLTGAYSRRHFLELADLELEQSRRFGHPLSLLIFDIDYFKRVNDEYGHPVGDEVLREMTRVCRECIRVTDLLGRYGGDEFVVLFPETSTESVRFVAERLRREVEDLIVRAKGTEIQCTVSIGISGLEPGMKDVDEMIESADEALYSAKKSGRNKLWSEPQALTEGRA